MKYSINALLILCIAIFLIACQASPSDSVGLDHVTVEDKDRAKVVRVIDGDTLDLLISGTKRRVRLFGVDTPERGERCYQEATERTRELSGEEVLIETGPRIEDRYGRLLFYLYTSDGRSIDAQLIQEGLATAWTKDGQYRDSLAGKEQEARRLGSGCLW